MARFDNPLDNLRVASPCNADWDQMVGNERARFCGQCNLNVYNLSSMTKADAERLIGVTEGRLCVRYYRRADGSILTSDCPVGLRAFRRHVGYVARAVASAVLSFLAGLGLYTVKSNFPMVVMGAPPPTIGLPVVQESSLPHILMGDVAMEPAPPERIPSPTPKAFTNFSRGFERSENPGNQISKKTKTL